MEVVVFGAGSLGSLVGGILARHHEVTLVGREPYVGAVRENGLRIVGELEACVSPGATTDGAGLEADLALVTVKAYDTETAARTLATGSFEAVCSLQNGMGNEEILARHLDAPVLSGTATYGALVREPGVVECTGRGEVVLGPREGGHTPLADRVGKAFERAGLETTVADDMPRRRWEKLAVNAGINPVTALTATRNGAVLDGPGNELARATARETARVARARGVSLSNREAVAALERVAEETAANASSMRQDVLADRRTEVDAINGYVVDRAKELDLKTPSNRLLAALVRAWERGQNVR